MDAKKFLSRAFHLRREIDTKIKLTQYLREVASSTSRGLDPTGISRTNKSSDKIADACAELVDISRECESDIGILTDMIKEIMSVIEQVDTTKLRTILYSRYILFMTWESISESVGCSYQHAHKLHKGALKTVQYILENQSDTYKI